MIPPNPFTDAYFHSELKFLGLQEPFTVGEAAVDMIRVIGRCDDYLNKNFRILEQPVPRLTIGGKLWMSITPMEVQSLAVPIQNANGVCATGGLGLGYFALRVAAKPDVEKLDVYEIDADVLEMFRTLFSGRPEYGKINLIHGDARQLLGENRYDYVFMDIYQTLLADSAISDIAQFREHNRIECYGWWGWEKVLVAAMIEYQLAPQLTRVESVFIRQWLTSTLPGSDAAAEPMGEQVKMVDLYGGYCDEEYVVACCRAMDRL